MNMMTLSVLLLLVVPNVEGFVCEECIPSGCYPTPQHCELVSDLCDCCDVCARTVGEKCGQFYPACETGLTCVQLEELDPYDEGNGSCQLL